jgi:hypothetical protein
LIPPVSSPATAAPQAEIERLEVRPQFYLRKTRRIERGARRRGGILEQVTDDKGGITKGAVAARPQRT